MPSPERAPRVPEGYLDRGLPGAVRRSRPCFWSNHRVSRGIRSRQRGSGRTGWSGYTVHRSAWLRCSGRRGDRQSGRWRWRDGAPAQDGGHPRRSRLDWSLGPACHARIREMCAPCERADRCPVDVCGAGSRVPLRAMPRVRGSMPRRGGYRASLEPWNSPQPNLRCGGV